MTTILFYGDSNTWGYDPAGGGRFSKAVRWTGVAARALGAGFDVIEEGLPGRTTIFDDPIEGLSADRNGARYLKPCLASHAPVDIVAVMLGTNDLKHRFGLNAFDIAQGAGELLNIVAGSRSGPGGTAPKMLLIAPPPIVEIDGPMGDMLHGGAEKSKKFAAFFATIAQTYGCAFLDSAEHWRVSPLDGIHYEADQHARFGQAVAEAILRI